MKKLVLSACVLFFAVWAVFAQQQERVISYQVLKPLTTVLIIALAFLSVTGNNKTYSRRLITALGFCLLGDVFLLQEQYFLFGLVSFLVAHLIFIYAFSSVYGFYKNVVPLLILVLVCTPYFLYLLPGLHNLTLPVSIYMMALLIMNWQAIGLFRRNRQQGYFLIAIGSLLFTLSDSMLAFAKFLQGFMFSDGLILGTYWAAIFIFAYSSVWVKPENVVKLI